MSTISLSFYEVSISKKREKELLDLTNFDGNNILDVFENFFKKIRAKTFLYKPNKQALSLYLDEHDDRPLYNRNGQYFNCLLNKGDYGSITPIIDTSRDSVSYTKKLVDADMIPMYFGAKIRSGYKKGVVAFQGIGVNSPKSLFQIALKEYMDKNYGNYKVTFNSVVPDNLLEKLIDSGYVKRFRFIKNTIPTDRVNFLDNNVAPTDGEAEFIISLKDKSSFYSKKLKKAVKSDDLGFITIKDFEPDATKVEIKVNGKTRIIHLNADQVISGRIDITGEVDLNQKGIPRFQDLNEHAVDFLDAISEKLD